MKNFKQIISEAKNSSKEDEGEYDYEGDMAKTQLYALVKNAKEIIDMLEDNTNLPEWVQSKITLACDYISTASDYLAGKEAEVKEGFDHNSIQHLKNAIVQHTIGLDKAIRNKDDNQKNYHIAMLAKAQAEQRRRDIQDFEEKRARQNNK